ncbi:MAG: ParA family protein [Blastocatellia bacterium]|nr:ParA family protein [Blastocatellia bacterium]
MTEIIAIFNQAGGVGKTSLTRDLGFELGSNGWKVLLIDADPQGTLGRFLGHSPGEEPPHKLFWQAVCATPPEGDRPSTLPAIMKTEFRVEIGLSNRTLIGDELSLQQQADPGRLGNVLEPLKGTYDFILVDCPPKISEITVQILWACDTLLIPVQTEAKGIDSFTEIQMEIGRAQRRRRNFKLPLFKVAGVVPTLFDARLSVHKHHLLELQEDICPNFGYQVFNPVRKYISVSEAGTNRQPLKVYDSRCPANEDIAHIATSFMENRKAMNS